MSGPIQRLHYFDQQFLRAQDFITEQEYHVALRRQHNSAVHGWGIGHGLTVAPTAATAVTVSAGYAIDGHGREIVLVDDTAVDLGGEPADETVFVTIAHAERTSDPTDETGVRDDTRWTEEPKLATSASPPDDPSVTLVLARVTRSGTQVSGTDESDRTEVSVPGAVAALQALIATRVAKSGDAIDGNLNIGGRASVGTSSTSSRLTVAGDVGIVKDLLRMGRLDGTQAAVSEVVGGIGFVGWSVQHGQLSFRAGEGFEMVDRTSDGPSLAYSLHQYPYARLRVGNLECRGGGTLRVDGDIAVGGKHAIRGTDTWLRLNQDGAFASGVHTPACFAPGSLNVGGAGGWGNPGGSNAWIAGNLGLGTTSLDARLTVGGGDIRLDNGYSVRSTGRLHIAPVERLYLLPPGGVYITRDWGGSGNLFTAGSIFSNGKGAGDLPGWSGGGVVCFDLHAAGGVYSPSKSFLIDHPLDPARMDLVHACLEGPENAVYYRGEAVLREGSVVVTLPSYFEALTRREGRTVIVTPKLHDDGTFSPLGASAIEEGRFVIRTTFDGHSEQSCFWEIKAVRADVDHLVIERPKNR